MSGPVFNPLFSAWLGRPPVDLDRVLRSTSSGVSRRSAVHLVGWKPVHVSARLAFERVEQRYAEMPLGAVDRMDDFLSELVGEFRSELLGYVTARRQAAENADRLGGGASRK